MPPPAAGNDNVHDEAFHGNDAEPVEPEEPVQTLESMVLQVFEDSINNDNAPAALPNADTVQFQPPADHLPAQQVLHVGDVITVFGPVLPPQMQWTRTFSKFMQCFDASSIPRPLQIPVFLFIKQPWSYSLSDGVLEFSLLPTQSVPVSVDVAPPTKCPVARALCFYETIELSEPLTEKF